MTFFANHVWTLCFDLTIMVVTPSEEHLSMASKQKLAGNGLATTSANATTASGSRKSRRSSQNHLPIIAIVKLIQLLGVLNLNENFSQLLQPAKTFKFFLETLSCNSSMNQPNCTISIIIRATRFTDHHQQQPQQQQCLTSNATASTLELVSAYLATLRLEFDSFHLYSTPMLQHQQEYQVLRRNSDICIFYILKVS